jgi:hypothetical protein
MPIKFDSYVPLGIPNKIHFYLLGERGLEVLFHFIIKAKIDEIIDVNSDVERGFSRDGSPNKDAWVMRARTKSYFRRLEDSQ